MLYTPFVGLVQSLFLVHASLGFQNLSTPENLTTPWLIDVVAVSNTSLLAEWEEVYVAKAIYLAKATADDAVASRCSCMVPCSGCLLENLRAGTSYNVSLKVCNDYTCISSDDFFQETTVPGVPGPPTNVSVVLLSPTDVKIQWDPPEVTNGEIANYTALIFEPFLFKCSFRGSVNASCILYDLYEGVTYGVVVRACNHANRDGHGGGCGQPSPTLTFTTWTGYLDDDIMKKLTPHLGRLPELQETTQAMIILPLSVLRLNVSGPLLKASLVVHCGHMSLNPHYNGSLKNAFGDVTLFIDLTQEMENALLNPIGNTYRNNTNGSWEVVVINESSKALSSLPDKHFILGDGLGRPKISHLYNGPLYPDTPYTVQLRLYLQEAYFTSASMIFSTRASPVAPLIIFASFGAIGLLGLLGFCIYLARRRTDQYAMLVSEDRDGETDEEEDSALQTDELSNSESNLTKLPPFRPVRVDYWKRPATSSYENQRIQPVAVENFSDYVERLLESPNGHAYIHFRLLNILSRQQENYWGLTTRFSAQFLSMTLNPNCPPYDQTVVVLDRSWAEYRAEPRTVLPHASLYENVYVDASYVTSCNYHQTGGFAIVPEFGNVPAFIAASTPMENTCLQFLTMVAQQCCPLIINLDELCQTQHFPLKHYWSNNAEQTLPDSVRACKVYVSGVYNSKRWITRTLKITPSDSRHGWTAEQMQISAWSSKRNPRPDILYEFVMAFLDKMATHSQNKRVGPPIIHANSTDGRVGTFIGATILLQQLQTPSNYIDVFGTILSLRKHRANLVNDQHQLEYLYRFMSYCVVMSATVNCEMPSLPDGRKMLYRHLE